LRSSPPVLTLDAPHEKILAVELLRFEDMVRDAAAEYLPNILTQYLWDLAKSFSGFYVNCPVLTAATPELRLSRLLLCDLTARVIQQTLLLLGIRTVDRM